MKYLKKEILVVDHDWNKLLIMEGEIVSRKYSFEDVVKEMTMIDVGGKAARQLDITEARQALSCFLRVAAKYMTLENVAGLISEAVEKEDK